jgi:hypothetical protein
MVLSVIYLEVIDLAVIVITPMDIYNTGILAL